MIKVPQLFCKNHAPRQLISYSLKKGTDDFCMPFFDSEPEFKLLPELPDGLVYSVDSGIVIKMKGVEPHRDEFVGSRIPGHTYVGAVFGILSGRAILQVSDYAFRLSPGDWVLFNNEKMHSLHAQTTWAGVSVQVLKPRKKK